MVKTPLTLRARLVALIGVLLAGVSLAIFAYFPRQLEGRAIAAQVATGWSIAEVTAYSAAPALVFRDLRGLDEAFAAALQTPDVLYVAAEDSAGVVASRLRTGAPDSLLVRLGAGRQALVERQVAHLATAITSGGRTVGRLRVGVSLTGVRREIGRARAAVALISLLVFGIGMAAALAIGTLTARPIRIIARTMEEIARGNRTLRAGVGGGAEVAQLARVFNDMVDSLDRARREVEDVNRTLQERVAARTSELEEAQSQLLQAQKMEAVGLLAGGLAHDFNNLLTTIGATTELLRDERPDDRALAEELDHIADAARRGADMIRQLMVFSRQQRLDLRAAELSSLVTDSVRMLRRLIRENVDIQLDLDSGPTAVRADRAAIQQILMNLATNASDAMRSGGSLRLETYLAEVDDAAAKSYGVAAPGTYVVLAVSDDGEGMPPDVVRHAFEPFFTTKAPGQGTGLGLASVYGLARQHAGFVSLHSEPGRGTTVKVYFPSAVEVEHSAGGLAPVAARGRGERVLIVEDEASLRRAAAKVLQRHGYEVEVASDGVEALELCKERPLRFAMILSDVVMPRMGGAEMMANLRGRGASVPVLFMSGYTARDMEHAGLLDPGAPLLQKPWTIAELTMRVRAVLDGKEG